MKLHARIPIAALFLALIGIAFTGHAFAQKNSNQNGSSQSEETAATDPLLDQVNKAIGISTRRYLTAGTHTPWQMMHGLLALRQDYQVKENGEKTSALGWMSRGATFRGEPWFEKTRYGGRAHPFNYAYAFEGHPNQFLAIYAMANVPMDHQFKTAGDGTITIADMVRHAQAEVNTGEEITWTLWALSHYVGVETKWENKYGEAWSIERLVRIQTKDSVHNAACGGTHGLFALTYARNRQRESKRPLRGVWVSADQKIKRYVAEARTYQNRDGTFSNSFFQGRSYSNNFEDRIGSSGHTLEFLMMALPDRRLKEEWVRRGVRAIAVDLIKHRKSAVECGSLYHALDGLVIYRNRVSPKPKPQIVDTSEPVEAPRPMTVLKPVAALKPLVERIQTASGAR